MYIFFSYLCYKSYYLFLTQIQICKSIRATPFSCYTLDYNLLCWLYHKDVLKLKNSVSKYIISDKNNLTACGSMDTKMIERYLTNLSYKPFHPLLIQTQLHKSIHAFPFSYCKFDYNHRCLLRHRDVLNI